MKKHRNSPAYARIKTLLDERGRRFHAFENEHFKPTRVEQQKGESPNDRNDRAIRVCAAWYQQHLKAALSPEAAEKVQVLLLTNDADNRRKAKETHNVQAYTGLCTCMCAFVCLVKGI